MFFVGALVAIDGTAGLAAPPTGAETEKVVGISTCRLDTTIARDGEATIRVRRGCFRFPVDPAAPYTLADIGTSAHAIDDATLSKAGKTSAGTVRDVEADGSVWIEL